LLRYKPYAAQKEIRKFQNQSTISGSATLEYLNYIGVEYSHYDSLIYYRTQKYNGGGLAI
jgi:hypothetical protein